MKIKLDENIPASLSTRLAALGHDVDSVPEEGLTGYPDTVVWSEAQAGGRFLVTQDLDFSDVRRFSPRGARKVDVPERYSAGSARSAGRPVAQAIP